MIRVFEITKLGVNILKVPKNTKIELPNNTTLSPNPKYWREL